MGGGGGGAAGGDGGDVKWWRPLVESSRYPLSMVVVQVLTTGMFLLSKAVLDNAGSIFAILSYRCVVGAIFVLPLALLVERGKWKEVCWKAFIWILVNALMGITTGMGFYYYGIQYTNATYSACFLNLVPIVTFIFAVLMRLERLGFDSKGGRFKIIGSIVCVGGAMVISLYNGFTFHVSSPHWETNGHGQSDPSSHSKLVGTLFLMCSCLCFSSWVIAQAKLFQIYPYKYSATMYICVAASLQSLVLGLALDAKKSAWMLNWDLQLLLIVYSGALNTGVTFVLVSWVVAAKGPSYSTMFNALSLILTTILEAVFMTGTIKSGSLIGIAMIIGGLYSYLWGRGNESTPKQIRDEEEGPKFSQQEEGIRTQGN